MKTLLVHASIPYTIYIAQGLLNTSLLAVSCETLDKRVALVTDTHLETTLGQRVLHQLRQHGLDVELFVFPAGEEHKTRENKQVLEDALLDKHYGRDTCLIALGGGVVLDLVGFLGATYCRGVPVIYIPTTLLAMVDASIGGKTGVNTPHGKNLIGTFTPPHMVLMDPLTLRSLPEHEWRNGVVEMIKHGLIADAQLFGTLQAKAYQLNPDDASLVDIIYTSCVIKQTIVEQDEREHGIRQWLNAGHTIGHAVEALEHFRLGHGEAVAIGLLVECYVACRMGLLSRKDFIALERVLRDYGLHLKTNAFDDKEAYIQQLLFDKKTTKQVAKFALLEAIGKPYREHEAYTVTVKPVYLDEALMWASQYFKA